MLFKVQWGVLPRRGRCAHIELPLATGPMVFRAKLPMFELCVFCRWFMFEFQVEFTTSRTNPPVECATPSFRYALEPHLAVSGDDNILRWGHLQHGHITNPATYYVVEQIGMTRAKVQPI